MTRHRLLRYFAYKQLPDHLQPRSKPFADLAEHIAGSESVDRAEQTVALRKLLEAKDCFVRSHIPDAEEG